VKKITVVLILGAFIATYVYMKVNDLSIPKITHTEQIEQSRIEKLNLLQTREYALNALKTVGRLNVLEGKYHYKNEIIDKGFMDLIVRQMTLETEYRFGIGIDLEYVSVRSVFDRIIVLQIPKQKLELQYIELDIEKSRIVNDNKMILVSDFKPSEVEVLLEESQYNVAGKINENDKLFDEALVNLKSELDGLMKRLGYTEVIFDIQ